jgi:hypothetical protein
VAADCGTAAGQLRRLSPLPAKSTDACSLTTFTTNLPEDALAAIEPNLLHALGQDLVNLILVLREVVYQIIPCIR